MLDTLRRRAGELKQGGLLAKLRPHVPDLLHSPDAGLQSSCLQLLAELMPDASDKQAGECLPRWEKFACSVRRPKGRCLRA